MTKTGLTLVLALTLPVLAWGQTPAQKLGDLLKSYQTVSADFEQVTKTDNNTRQRSSGHLSVARPDRFHWQTEQPFPQTIISDGAYLWVYDPDLEQATRKPVDAAQSNAAALILNGDIEQLQAQYQVVETLNQPQRNLFELTPKNSQSQFQQVRLYFSHGVMTELMLEDMLGQQTIIMLHNTRLNSELAPELFQFKPPEGVDVIISDE